MRNLVVGMVTLACALTESQLAKGEPAGDPRGVWLTEAGDAKVRVSKCGQALCGAIVWLKEPIDSVTGKSQIDDKNPNPALARPDYRAQPVSQHEAERRSLEWSHLRRRQRQDLRQRCLAGRRRDAKGIRLRAVHLRLRALDENIGSPEGRVDRVACSQG